MSASSSRQREAHAVGEPCHPCHRRPPIDECATVRPRNSRLPGRDLSRQAQTPRCRGQAVPEQHPAGTVSRLAGDEPRSDFSRVVVTRLRRDARRSHPGAARRPRCDGPTLPSTELAFYGLGLIFANSSTATSLALAKSRRPGQGGCMPRRRSLVTVIRGRAPVHLGNVGMRSLRALLMLITLSLSLDAFALNGSSRLSGPAPGIATRTPAPRVATGSAFSCALRPDGSGRCWGGNPARQPRDGAPITGP